MAIPTTHLAAASSVATKTNNIKELPTVLPGEGEVLVRIDYAAVNPIDWKIVQQLLPSPPKDGRVVGQDGAGQVVAVGSGVDGVQVGDQVLFQANLFDGRTSTFQQYATFPAQFAVKRPDNITAAEAATVPLGTLTPLIGLYHPSGHSLTPPWSTGGESVGKGKSILIPGAASSVGQFAVQLARLSGFSSIITTSSATNFDLLKSQGATTTLDRKSATATDIVAAAGDSPLSHVFDAIASADTAALTVAALQASAKKFPQVAEQPSLFIVSVGGAPEEVAASASSSSPPIELRKIFGSAALPTNADIALPFLRALEGPQGYLATGLIVPNKVRIVPGGLNAVDEALRISQAGVSGVKLVLNIAETKGSA